MNNWKLVVIGFFVVLGVAVYSLADISPKSVKTIKSLPDKIWQQIQ